MRSIQHVRLDASRGSRKGGQMPEQQQTTRAGDETKSTLALTQSECELIELALGQLLAGARREEHMIPEIRALLTKIRAVAQAA